MLPRDFLENKTWRLIAVGTVVMLLLVLWAFLPQQPVFRVTFLSVGEGDSIVLRAPNGETALIDAGPGPSAGSNADAGEKVVLPYLMRQGVRKLDAVILTHPHEDHVGGMASVLQMIDTEMVIDCGAAHASPGYEKLLKLIDEKHIPYHRARRGDEIKFGDVTLQVLNPPPYRTEGDLNDRSIVLRATYGKTSFLFAADAGREAEIEMMDNCPEQLQATVLKVAHHGAEMASSEDFLQAIRPKVAVISLGKNSFGHPSKKTIARLQAVGSRIYRTDKCGAITIESNGEKLRISTCRT